MRLGSVSFPILLLALVTLSGCMVVQVGVTNPIPGMTRVAVVPFFNQSNERSVDGQRFAAAYRVELQKTPGFQVVANDVTERAIIDSGLQMSGPEDVLELARILNVDAVVMGSVTEYSPYPPPQLGLHVAWYSPYEWEFFPGVQSDMFARRRFMNDDPDLDGEVWEHPGEEQGWERVKRVNRRVKRSGRRVVEVIRGQSDDFPVADENSDDESSKESPAENSEDELQDDGEASKSAEETSLNDEPTAGDSTADKPAADESEKEGLWRDRLLWAPRRGMKAVRGGMDSVKWGYKEIVEWATSTDEQDARPYRKPPEPPPGRMPRDIFTGLDGELTDANYPQYPQSTTRRRPAPTRTNLEAGLPAYPLPDPPPEHDPLKPFMSYTRIFDGADADFQASLRDYLEVRGELRSGGWKGYLNRSEDFIRFTAHLMIVEMLTLHGGEGKRRIIFKHRKYK